MEQMAHYITTTERQLQQALSVLPQLSRAYARLTRVCLHGGPDAVEAKVCVDSAIATLQAIQYELGELQI